MLKKTIKFFMHLLSTSVILAAGLAYLNPVMTENADIVLANPQTWYDTPHTEALANARAVFLGDSITYGFNIDEHFSSTKLEVMTSGVSGEKTFQTLERLDEQFYALNPQKIFLLIGTNDLAYGNKNPSDLAIAIKQIITELQANLPYTEIFVESIYPVNTKDFPENGAKSMVASRNNQIISAVNRELIRVTRETQTTYIDVYPYLLDEKGQLKKDFSIEGLHLTEAGYAKVADVLQPYLEN